MRQRRRIYYSSAQRSEIWDRWRDHRICRGKDHIRRKPYDFLCHAAHPLLAFTAER
jgi:hypothetical protein